MLPLSLTSGMLCNPCPFRPLLDAPTRDPILTLQVHWAINISRYLRRTHPRTVQDHYRNTDNPIMRRIPLHTRVPIRMAPLITPLLSPHLSYGVISLNYYSKYAPRHILHRRYRYT